jgi:hypothetical protein
LPRKDAGAVSGVKVLNVAGLRASTEPKIGQFVMALLDEVLGVPD